MLMLIVESGREKKEFSMTLLDYKGFRLTILIAGNFLAIFLIFFLISSFLQIAIQTTINQIEAVVMVVEINRILAEAQIIIKEDTTTHRHHIISNRHSSTINNEDISSKTTRVQIMGRGADLLIREISSNNNKVEDTINGDLNEAVTREITSEVVIKVISVEVINAMTRNNPTDISHHVPTSSLDNLHNMADLTAVNKR
jgi:hypothetical protein